MAQKVQAIAEETLGFACVLFEFERLELMLPETCATGPAKRQAQPGNELSESFRFFEVSRF